MSDPFAVVGIKPNGDLPDEVRARLAGNMADPSKPEGAALSSAFAQLIAARPDTLTRRALLLDAGSSDRQASAASAVATYDDAVPSQFRETWANLSQWVGSGPQVSGGRVFSGVAGGGANAGIGHAWDVGAQPFRAVFNVHLSGNPVASTSSQMVVGVSSDAAAPAAGAASVYGISFSALNKQLGKFTAGAAEWSSGPILQPAGSSDWIVTVASDGTYLSVIASRVDNDDEFRARWLLSTIGPIRKLAIFNNDARQLTGHSVGLVGATMGLTTLATRMGVEGVQQTIVWTAVGTVGMRVALPPNYDARKPSPLAILFHGNGSDETHFADNGNGRAIANALLAAGYVVASASFGTGATAATWGSDSCITSYTALYRYVRDRFNIGPVVFYANSMGSIEALNLLARDTIPGVRAYACTVPTWDLAENRANALFTNIINGAYGNNYPANSVGHDPALMDPTIFRGIPVWMLVATDDAAVTPAPNGLAMHAALVGKSPVTKVEVTGGHSTGQIANSAPAVVTFFNEALGR